MTIVGMLKSDVKKSFIYVFAHTLSRDVYDETERRINLGSIMYEEKIYFLFSLKKIDPC